jgi:hypothetical protein
LRAIKIQKPDQTGRGLLNQALRLKTKFFVLASTPQQFKDTKIAVFLQKIEP